MWPFKKKETRSAYTLTELEALLGVANSRSGVAVDSTTAQTLAAVFSAVSFISKGVAGYPLSAQGALDGILNQSPDGVMTAYHWRSAVLQNLLATGNAYSRLRWKRDGMLDKVEFLHSSRVSPVIEPTHKLKGYLVDGKPVGRSNMLHFKINAYDGLIGKSPISVCRESVGLGLAQQNQAADQIKNGLKPSGVLKTESNINGSEHLERLQSHLTKQKDGQVLLLEGGLDFKPISFSNADAEFLESRRFSVDEVARMFNLDKIWLQNSQTGARYDELGASQKALLCNTLQPYMIEIESELSLKLGQPISFNLAEIQRLDPKTRYETYKAAIDAQILTAEEVRQREGFA